MKSTKANQVVKPLASAGGAKPPGGNRKINIATGESPRNSGTLDLIPKWKEKEDSKNQLSDDK